MRSRPSPSASTRALRRCGGQAPDLPSRSLPSGRSTRGILRVFDGSDVFGAPRVEASEDEGRRLTLDIPLQKNVFLFGTDGNGRDLLTRTLIAGRVSLAVGLLASFVALVIGVAYGAIAGFAGGAVDVAMMRIVEILYALPFIFFVIVLVMVFGRNFALIFVAIGAVEWLDMARLARGQTLSLKAEGVCPRRARARRRPGGDYLAPYPAQCERPDHRLPDAARAARDPARKLHFRFWGSASRSRCRAGAF